MIESCSSPPPASYVLIRDGQIQDTPESSFRLHDSPEEFKQRPRVFTTFCALADAVSGKRWRIPFLAQHLSRLARDAEALGILSKSLPEHQNNWLANALINVLRSQISIFDLRIRLVLGSSGAEIFLDQLPATWRGTSIRLRSIAMRRELPEHKTCNTSVSRKARALAEAEGFEEALLLDPMSGKIREGAWTNFFWFDYEGRLHTSGQDILPGLTRGAIMQLRECTLSDVRLVDIGPTIREAFVSQSTSGITPVSEIDGGSIAVGNLVEKLRMDFRQFSELESLAVGT